jgi:hypothetical protein
VCKAFYVYRRAQVFENEVLKRIFSSYGDKLKWNGEDYISRSFKAQVELITCCFPITGRREELRLALIDTELV